MRVLWFSNCVLSEQKSKSSGSWLFAMKDVLKAKVVLVNVTTKTGISNVIQKKEDGLVEYLLPTWKLSDGIPEEINTKQIQNIIDQENPDVVHIWGLESYWALMFVRKVLNHRCVLLEMQGVISSIVDVFYGGLTTDELKHVKSIKSVILKNRSLTSAYKRYQKKTKFEKDIVSHLGNIAVQSTWTQNQLQSKYGDRNFYHSLRPIREEFYNANKWEKQNRSNIVLFSSFSYYASFKGLHILLKALALMKRVYPQIELRIAGQDLNQKPIFALGDYESFILYLVNKLNIKENVKYLGLLSATDVINQIHDADVVVNPSFVESYSAVAAESLFLGAPTVLAYSGAMPGFSEEKEVALYYNPLDYASCASCIHTLLLDKERRDYLQRNSLNFLPRICGPDSVVQRQLAIYQELIKNCEA